MSRLLTIKQYQQYRQDQGLPVPCSRTVKRHIQTHKLYGERDINGHWLVDPLRQVEQNQDTTTHMEGKVGRRRHAKHRGLPDNLYARNIKGTVYFQYKVPKHIDVPDNQRWQSLGSDEAEACDAARQLNQQFGLGADLFSRVLARVEGADNDFCHYVDHYLETLLPEKRINGQPFSPDTITEYTRICKNFKSQWPNKTFATLKQADIANYLTGLSTPDVKKKYRTRLSDIYKHAISDGLTKENLPLNIVLPSAKPVERHRLDLAGYKAVFKNASPRDQLTMELALNLMNRRKDIQSWRFDDKKDDGYYYKIISKTKKRGKESYIRIPANFPLIHSELGCKTLDELMEYSKKLMAKAGYISPYVVHYRPRQRKPSKDKQHWTQPTRDTMSRGFNEALKKSGYYQHLTTAERPSLHECIALGEHLMEKAGYPEEYIQALRGHRKIETTRMYLEGHEWTTIELPKT